MNRRELFQTLAAVPAVAGAPVRVSTVDADARPVLVILEVPGKISYEVAERTQAYFETHLQAAFPGIKAIVLADGMTVTFIDDHGRPIDRPME